LDGRLFRYSCFLASASRMSLGSFMSYRSYLDLVLCPVSFIATVSDTPDSLRFLAAVLLKSWKNFLPIPAASHAALREYWLWKNPQEYLFPGEARRGSNGGHLSPKAVYHACKGAARRAGIQKKVGPCPPQTPAASFKSLYRKYSGTSSAHNPILYAGALPIQT
jgi:hypothetical protein